MADWSNPNHLQLTALHEALLFAYPSRAKFKTFLLLRLDKRWDEIAPDGLGYTDQMLEVLVLAKAGGWLAGLVKNALRDRPNSPLLVLLDNSYDLTGVEVPDAAGGSLEDIVRVESGFSDPFPWIEKLTEVTRGVCRVEHPVGRARGTGWLVAPDLVLTNWHVVRHALGAGDIEATWAPGDFACRFDYAVNDGVTQEGSVHRLATDWCADWSPASNSEFGAGPETPTADTLDYALIRLADPINDRGSVEVSEVQSMPAQGSVILIVQHPDGEPAKLTIGVVRQGAEQSLRLYHDANTIGGSSGSVVLNAKLEAVALHHAGDLLYNQTAIGEPEQNQAVPITEIITRLEAKGVPRFWRE